MIPGISSYFILQPSILSWINFLIVLIICVNTVFSKENKIEVTRKGHKHRHPEAPKEEEKGEKQWYDTQWHTCENRHWNKEGNKWLIGLIQTTVVLLTILNSIFFFFFKLNFCDIFLNTSLHENYRHIKVVKKERRQHLQNSPWP